MLGQLQIALLNSVKIHEVSSLDLLWIFMNIVNL